MSRIALPVIVFGIVVALNSWGAEQRKPAPPLMPPNFPQAPFPQSPFAGAKGDAKRGEVVYQQNSCPTCHTIGVKGGKVGPDLSRVGEVRPAPDWYRQHLVSAHKPPVILVAQDLDDLIAYLLNLKLFR